MNFNKNIIRKIIRKQINEVFEFNNKNKTFVPPHNISKFAEKILNIYQNNHLQTQAIDSNEGSGINKIKDLINRKPQNFAELKRLKAYFDNHQNEVSKIRNNNNIKQIDIGTLKEMKLHPLLLQWNLHGGDITYLWVKQAIQNNYDNNMRTKSNIRDAGGAGYNKGMGVMRIKYDPTKMRIHR